mmetsp:Transcript_74904/g.211618  ORF Transcript_74904/g.211618 Transcript_74904/m.211618 type:complete len:419 (-) Transcript_74904:336-1592(-)
MDPAGGPDGGSDVSYESVASEGGYEPASERGRDPLPRIISSSHCVEVFRRIRWTDGAYCCHAPSLDDDDDDPKAQVRDPQLRPHNPLHGLPPRILRFDGAMEAWLEEMPLPRNPQYIPRPYTALNDAATRHVAPNADLSILRAGNRRATLWYFTLEFLQQLWPHFLQPDGSGFKLWERALLDRGCNIQSTHIEVGRVHCPPGKSNKQRGTWLKALFTAMQASKWTPDGEARSLLVTRRLSHASMSIGDAVQIGGELYVAGLSGFIAVKEGERLLPPNFEPDAADQDQSAAWPAGTTDAAKEPEPSQAREGAKPPGKKGATEKKGGKGGRGKGGGEAEGGGKKGGKGKGRGKNQNAQNQGAPNQGGQNQGGQNQNAQNQNGERPAKDSRAKEPGPADRADRRKLRAQLQAKREQLQGGH